MRSRYARRVRSKQGPGHILIVPAIVIALCAVALSLACSGSRPAEPPQTQEQPALPPEQASPLITEVHLTMPRDPARSVSVNWASDSALTATVVEYGTTQDFGQSAEGSFKARGQELLHAVELSNLVPDTPYYYRCGDGAGNWSARRAFRTAPVTTAQQPLVFAAMGDSRNGVKTFTRIAAAAQGAQLSFTLFTGDAVDSGSSPTQWVEWFRAAGTLDETAALMPTLGNHEDYAALYFDQFDLPGNERWYSFDWGNTHVVCLDSEAIRAGEQRQWLEEDLSAADANPAITWKVVFFHEPPFSSGLGHGSNTKVREAWCPLFDRYHVDLVLSGHEHNYERSGPVNFTASSSALMPDWTDARCYVVTGGAGAPLSPLGTSWWTEARGALFHWVEVTVSGKNLRLETFDLSGNIIDSLELSKPESAGGV